MRTWSPIEGVELRPLTEADTAALFAAVDRNRERLRRWLPWVDRTHSPDDSRAFLRAAAEQGASREALHYGIWAGDGLVGGIGSRIVDWDNRSAPIGYWLDAAWEGRGLATRSCRVLLDYLFFDLRLHRVEIRCGTGNTRSCAIPARLGFTREGVLREAERVGDRYHDLVVWSILEREWQLRRPSPPAGA